MSRNAQNYQRFFNPAGFTLIEILVVTVIVGILSLAMASVLEFTYRSQFNTDTMSAMNDLSSDLRNSLGIPSICTVNFKNFLDSGKTSIEQGLLASDGKDIGLIFKDLDKNIKLIEKGKPINPNFQRVLVQSIELKDVVTIAKDINLGPSGIGTRFQGNLAITIDKGASFIGSRTVNKSLSISIDKPDVGAGSCTVGTETFDVAKIQQQINQQITLNVKDMCTQLGGVLNTTNPDKPICNPAPIPPRPPLTLLDVCSALRGTVKNGVCSLSKTNTATETSLVWTRTLTDNDYAQMISQGQGCAGVLIVTNCVTTISEVNTPRSCTYYCLK